MTALVAALKSLAGWLLENLLDPRFWAIGAILVSAGYLKGCSDEAERFAEWKETAARIGKAYESWANARNKASKAANQEVVNGLKKDLDRVTGDNRVLLDSLRHHANRSSLPPAAPPTGGGAPSRLICFERAELDEGDQRLRRERAEFLGRLALRYGKAEAVVRACLDWDDRQRAVEAALPEPTTR